MKSQTIVTLLFMLFPLTAQAASSFGFDEAPVPAAARPAPAIPAPVTPAVTQAPQCTSNYAKAFELFKAGKDIDLRRVPEFEASFSGMTSTNRFVSRRGAIYLNMNINDQLQVEVPLTVCLADGTKGQVLTAKIITSKAVDPGTTQPNEMVMSALQDPAKGVPRQITIKIAKTGNQVVFAGTEVEFEASATLK